MNDLQIFNYNGNDVRTVEHDGDTWWVLKDVCDILGLTTPARVSERLEEDEVSSTHITDSLGRVQATTIISESGLYNVILRSDKPEARDFKRWVTHYILPSIRKHGAYMTPAKIEEILADPDTIIKLATALKDERAAKEQLQIEAAKNAPKVIFADAVAVSDGALLVGELAKLLRGNGVELGQNRLYEKLRQDGYLIKRKGTDYNMPTQRSMELGLFKVKETAITHSDGHVGINKTVKVTGKGQSYFINLYLKELSSCQDAKR